MAGLKRLKLASSLRSPAGILNFTLKQKGKILTMAVKEYPHYNLKKAFWRWHFNSRPGEDLIKEAVDKLVLYTNINKETAAYRLFRIVRGEAKTFKVGMKAKRLGLVLFFLVKTAAMRRMRECFGELKNYIRMGRIDASRRILEMAHAKRKKAFNHWRDVNNQMNRLRNIQSNFLRKMLDCQVGRIYSAIQIMKTLPQRANQLDTVKPNKFEAGLSKFLRTKLKSTFEVFKNDN